MEGFRRFIDSTGFSWQIWEIAQHAHDVPADSAPAPSWLYFFSRGTTLVLDSFPDEWSTLEWKELEDLRRRAAVLGSDTDVRVPAESRARATGAHATV